MSPHNSRQLGPKIREYRQDFYLNLSELAQKTGLSATYLSRIERGLNLPSLELLARLAIIFGQNIRKADRAKGKCGLCRRNSKSRPIFEKAAAMSLFSEFLEVWGQQCG